MHTRRVETRPFGSILALAFTTIFLLSVPVAFLSPLVAKLMWAATIVFRVPLRALAARLAD